ncbi:MAG TPA: VOC family protein [Candidatus Acidoferrales bacterium]|nr:VOC family protein [Candidatus Acidoferrales bacterium]
MGAEGRAGESDPTRTARTDVLPPGRVFGYLARMIDHIGIRVRDYARAKTFYTAALAPLGYQVTMELTPEMDLGYIGVGLGIDRKPDFWIGQGQASGPVHIAIVAADRKAVDAFYVAAMAAGGKDNGAPGVRAHYHPSYYGAFVLDAEGNNIEAVCHQPA